VTEEKEPEAPKKGNLKSNLVGKKRKADKKVEEL
jgi:hypothetical protein